MTPPFAFLDNAREAMNELVENLLLVAGGFLVGYLIGWVGGWAIGRYVLRMKDTSGVKVVARPVCGMAVALIVALIVFTGKGKPHGDGGDGKGSPDANTSGKNAPPKADADPKRPPDDLKKPPEVKPPDVLIPVTLYGGPKAAGQRYYQFDGETELRTLEGLKTAILARKAVEKGKVSLAIRYPTDVGDHPGDPRVVTQLTEWANSQGLDVTFPANR